MVWGRHRFLGEEGEEEDREAKKAGCSPWKRADIVALAGTVALDDIAALAGTVAGTVADTVAGTVTGIALVEES